MRPLAKNRVGLCFVSFVLSQIIFSTMASSMLS